MDFQTAAIALGGGLVPSLIWLLYWLREDRCAPEPKRRIVLTFVAGMAVVAIALPIEEMLYRFMGGLSLLSSWAILEELLKLLAAAAFGLWSAENDEPIDAVIYMVTAALGFAAAENALFLMRPIQEGVGTFQILMTEELRFVGATLLHTLASGTVGLFLAFTFFSTRHVRKIALSVGVILAIVLHTLFNFFILQTGGGVLLSVFLSIWAGIVVILFLIERVKHCSPKSIQQ